MKIGFSAKLDDLTTELTGVEMRDIALNYGGKKCIVSATVDNDQKGRDDEAQNHL